VVNITESGARSYQAFADSAEFIAAQRRLKEIYGQTPIGCSDRVREALTQDVLQVFAAPFSEDERDRLEGLRSQLQQNRVRQEEQLARSLAELLSRDPKPSAPDAR
jgi:hypothetical protein